MPGEHIFSEYAYFSSYSDSWVAHAKRYADEMTAALGLTAGSLVTEVASNDGYLLQHFVAAGIPVLGVEPAAQRREGGRRQGHHGPWSSSSARRPAPRSPRSTARRTSSPPTTSSRTCPTSAVSPPGLRALVKDSGLVTLEFPHLLRLIERRQYDTIYHEHFSYLSLLTASRALETGGLRVVDVEELEHAWRFAPGPRAARRGGRRAHGAGEGGARRGGGRRPAHGRRARRGSPARCCGSRATCLTFLIGAAAEGKTVAGYGAPGKGNTLLNHCGIRSDLLSYTVDRSPVKQGKFLPGTHIPIHAPDRLAETKPDYVLVLPWNLREEISEQLSYVRSWGGPPGLPHPRTRSRLNRYFCGRPPVF